MPLCLCLVVLFVLWLRYELKKADKNSYSSADFWKRESSAIYVPRQSTEDIEYIEIPDDIIPRLREDASADLKESCNDLTDLQSRKIADLSRYSNTDLKLKYGTGNFNDLSLADGYFIRLVQVVTRCCCLLDEENYPAELSALLDFADANGVHTKKLDELHCKTSQ